MVSSVHGGDGKTKVLLDTGVGKMLLYGYENLGGRKGGVGGGGREGERRDGEMEDGSQE